MIEEYADVQKHAGVAIERKVIGQEPPMGHRWYAQETEARALEKLGAVCKAIIPYPTGQLVFVFDSQDAIAHKGMEVRRAMEIDDAQRNGPLASLVDWARGR